MIRQSSQVRRSHRLQHLFPECFHTASGRIGQMQTRFNTFYSRGAGTPVNQSDNLDGTRVGLGAEIPASRNTFVRMDYSYTRYNDALTVSPSQPTADIMRFDNTETLARLGLGYRF